MKPALKPTLTTPRPPEQAVQMLAPPEARRVKREVVLALVLLFGGTGLLAVAQVIVPAIASATQLGLAIMLFQIPERLLGKKIAPPCAEISFQIGPVRPGLALAGKAMAIVFPLFVVGFFAAYAVILDRPIDIEARRLLRWGDSLEWAPSIACGRAETLVWTQESQLWLVPNATQALRAKVTVGGHPVTEARKVSCTGRDPHATQPNAAGPTQAEADGSFNLPRGGGLWIELGTETQFELQLFDAKGPLPRQTVRLGANGDTPSDDGRVAGSRDIWWLLAAIVIHLGLVALPEEHFFRGYLLPRLDQLWGRRRRLFGVEVGWGLVVSSLAFAALHPILIPGPHRLLVFFPALLFGWLRARSGTLGAAILVHASSNILLAIVSRMVG